jgi:putative FmdB family regulatory protein
VEGISTPIFDFTCTEKACGKTDEYIVTSADTEETTCKHCGAKAARVPGIMAPGSKRHVAVFFNYLAD